MSQEVLITQELVTRQPPEAQAIIRLLLATMATFEAGLSTLT